MHRVRLMELKRTLRKMNPILTFIVCKNCGAERPYHRDKCHCGATEVTGEQTFTEVIGQ